MSEWPEDQAYWEEKTPTNRVAAKRPYCTKHSRAKLDIGGVKECTQCREEKLKQEEKEGE